MTTPAVNDYLEALTKCFPICPRTISTTNYFDVLTAKLLQFHDATGMMHRVKTKELSKAWFKFVEQTGGEYYIEKTGYFIMDPENIKILNEFLENYKEESSFIIKIVCISVVAFLGVTAVFFLPRIKYILY